MHTRTLSELSSALENGELSSVELTQHYLDRIASLDTELNSFITVTKETALVQAQAAVEEQGVLGSQSAPIPRNSLS